MEAEEWKTGERGREEDMEDDEEEEKGLEAGELARSNACANALFICGAIALNSVFTNGPSTKSFSFWVKYSFVQSQEAKSIQTRSISSIFVLCARIASSGREVISETWKS